MLTSRELLVGALAPLFKSCGYKKTACTWRKSTSDTILVVSLEKNRWGSDSYEFRAGIYLRALGSETSPTYNRCQIEVSPLRLAKNHSHILQACDFSCQKQSQAERLEIICGFVQGELLAALSERSDVSSLRRLALNRTYPADLAFTPHANATNFLLSEPAQQIAAPERPASRVAR